MGYGEIQTVTEPCECVPSVFTLVILLSQRCFLICKTRAPPLLEFHWEGTLRLITISSSTKANVLGFALLIGLLY